MTSHLHPLARASRNCSAWYIGGIGVERMTTENGTGCSLTHHRYMKALTLDYVDSRGKRQKAGLAIDSGQPFSLNFQKKKLHERLLFSFQICSAYHFSHPSWPAPIIFCLPPTVPFISFFKCGIIFVFKFHFFLQIVSRIRVHFSPDINMKMNCAILRWMQNFISNSSIEFYYSKKFFIKNLFFSSLPCSAGLLIFD